MCKEVVQVVLLTVVELFGYWDDALLVVGLDEGLVETGVELLF